MVAALTSTDAASGATDHLLASIALRLDGAAEKLVEAELRLADDADRSALFEFSLAVALEAQGRRREAYESVLQLVDDPVCGHAAAWTAARLAALLGEGDAARRHVQRALADTHGDAAAQEFAYPSQLEVLSQLDPKTFWQRWETAPERTKKTPQYWRVAAYTRAIDAVSIEDLDRAIELFEQGLGSNPDPVRRAGIDVGILQVLRSRLIWQMDEQVEDGPQDALAEELRQLASRAEDLMARSEAKDLPQSITADALLVAAQCRFDLGDWDHARQLYDRAIRLDAPEPLADYVRQVSTLAIVELLDARREGMPPIDALGPLRASTTLALERAYRIRTTSRRGFNDDPAAMAAADIGVLACSAYLGLADAAQQAARSWQPMGEALDPNVQLLAERLLDAGGLLLDVCDFRRAELPQRMLAAVHGLERARARGDYTKEQAARILNDWRKHRLVIGRFEDPDMRPYRDASERLRKQLR